MFDARVRKAIAPILEPVAIVLDRAGVPPLAITGTGFLAGVGAIAAAATKNWDLALGLWLLNRLLDGLDGPVARRRGPTEVGGFLDLVADFTVYGGFVVAVGIALPQARIACLALLLAYYASGTAFLAISSILERRGESEGATQLAQDGRSLRFVGGLAEGTETVLAYVMFCLLPSHATVVAWIFTAAVAVTALQRVAFGIRVLRLPDVPPLPRPVGPERPGGVITAKENHLI